MKSRRIILISGCPRSGTSWVHFLISSHPKALTCRETHLYDKYIGPLKEWFDKEVLYEGNDGLSALFSESEFVEEILSPLVEKVFMKVSSHSAENKVIVEKTPASILHHDLIKKIQKDALMLFVVRDPRAVFASFKAGSRENWGSWMKKGVSEFCHSWNKYAYAYFAAQSYWGQSNLLLVQYEKLKLDPVNELRKVYDQLTLDSSIEMIEKVICANKIDVLRDSAEGTVSYDKRNSFYRNGKAFGWVDELSLTEIKDIEFYCKDVMTLFGYKAHKC
ncbi:sulfotransferase [Alteromonas mediterranea]|uniref:sulfotransferase family protein n=1 Tax=Alteromonas mediterranea TaxID=314275 RepID=UPI001131AD38|nr:sulfotransferase [Alteromonas mediterranea]QDG39804.1 sulfotransferase [Alteromonas mediterranea]